MAPLGSTLIACLAICRSSLVRGGRPFKDWEFSGHRWFTTEKVDYWDDTAGMEEREMGSRVGSVEFEEKDEIESIREIWD